MKINPEVQGVPGSDLPLRHEQRSPLQPVLVGSRGSRLALIQTEWVIRELRTFFPHIHFVIREIKTRGDKILDTPLARVGDKGLFVKEIEASLLSGEIDFAVHSLKDLPTAIPRDLTIGCVTLREEPWDVLVSDGRRLEDLPSGARLGTSSLRRIAQLLHYRPDFELVSLRGNLNTRLQKFDQGGLDGIILAYAGLKRLGMEARITQVIPEAVCLPAVGQGALAVECRREDHFIQGMLFRLEDGNTRCAVQAERAFLERLEGGCQIPIGCHARVEQGRLVMTGIVAGLTGTPLLREEMTVAADDPESAGDILAQRLLERGAGKILDEVRKSYEC